MHGRFALITAVAALAGCAARRPVPQRLSETGLYADAATRTLAPGVTPFAPAFPLWSDGAEKQRWIWLPPGAAVDQRDVEHWRFPDGTRVWKEFRRDGRRLETRLIERRGPNPGDVWMGAFVWYEAGRDAVFREEGATDVNGTDHDVPSADRCASCHGGEPGRILGYSAVQLGGAGGLRGEPRARAALGYLHANCGHCHGATGLAYREVDLVLRLSAGARAAAETDAARTAVGVPVQRAIGGLRASRVAPGRADRSALLARMRSADPNLHMPPLGSERLDEAGAALVAAWIEGLSNPE